MYDVWHGMARTAPVITLSETQANDLQRISRASSSRSEVLRARIVMLAAKRWPNEEIVHELSTNKMTVSKWRRRFAKMGMAGLQDAARAGRPATLSEAQMHRFLAEVTRPPQDRARWSCRSMD